MRKEARVLLSKAVDSLILSVDRFNSALDRGREETVLILMDRAFELILKAAILHQGGKIRERRAKETIGFDKCVRKCLSDETVKCLTEDNAVTIQVINSLRDAAQHYIMDISEQQLYLYSQAGVTVFAGLLRDVFGRDLIDFVPSRVLPVSSSAPQSMESLIETEFREISTMVRPGARRHLQARARVRSLAIIEASLSGVRSQPSDGDLNRILSRVSAGERWNAIFPGIARLKMVTDEADRSISIRLSKSEGEPVRLVPEGTPGATIVAVHKVDLLSFYSLGLKALAQGIGLSAPKTLALIKSLKLQDCEDCFKVITVGKAIFKRYSPKALERLRKAKECADMGVVWQEFGAKRTHPKAS